MLSKKTVRTIGSVIVVVAIIAIVFSACGKTKFSGTWDVNDGEIQIEFLNGKQCVMNDDLIGGYDVYEYEVVSDDKIIFSAGGESAVMVYEITDKSSKKMIMDEYDDN